jgi:Tfp pilus assembly protein PilO
VGKSASKGAEFSQIISKLEALAKEANIHMANVQPQQALTKGVVRIFPVEIDIDGSWPAMARFLYLVQAPPNSFNVEELNLERFSEAVTNLRGRIVLSRARIINAANPNQ